MQRVLVYGVTGSGKTTLAARIAERTGLPWHSVDDLVWLPGWVQLPEAEQRNLVNRLCAGDRWVLDHAYGTWVDVPLGRADVVVGLDYPRWLSFGRLLSRTVVRAVTKTQVCGGNTESWRQALSRDSILLWHVTSFRSKRARLRAWATDPAGPTVVHLRSPRETERWLSGLTPP